MQIEKIIEALETTICLIEKNAEVIEMTTNESAEYEKAVQLLRELKSTI